MLCQDVDHEMAGHEILYTRSKMAEWLKASPNSSSVTISDEAGGLKARAQAAWSCKNPKSDAHGHLVIVRRASSGLQC